MLRRHVAFGVEMLMHGCGDLNSRIENSVSEQLVSWGYVVFVVDSFATWRTGRRGPPETCRQRIADLSSKGQHVQLEVLPGALHDFDAPEVNPGDSILAIGWSIMTPRPRWRATRSKHSYKSFLQTKSSLRAPLGRKLPRLNAISGSSP